MKVLIADDDPISRWVVEAKAQSWGYTVVTATDGTTALELLLSEDPPRLAILDWMMPGLDGVTVLQRLRAARVEPYIYTLILTAKTELADLIAAMDAGADDFLTKPVVPNELKVRMRAGCRIVELQADLIAAREELRVQATRDGLTGLWNRTAVFDVLRRELARCARQDSPLAVCMVDIDHFKAINDTHGHATGDTVLREVAQRLRVRPYDAVGRYGGEEFLVVLPGCDGSNAGKVAERLRRAVAEPPITLPDGSALARAPTVSLGVGWRRGGDTVERLLHRADEALYAAKRGGRDRVACEAGAPPPAPSPLDAPAPRPPPASGKTPGEDTARS